MFLVGVAQSLGSRGTLYMALALFLVTDRVSLETIELSLMWWYGERLCRDVDLCSRACRFSRFSSPSSMFSLMISASFSVRSIYRFSIMRFCCFYALRSSWRSWSSLEQSSLDSGYKLSTNEAKSSTTWLKRFWSSCAWRFFSIWETFTFLDVKRSQLFCFFSTEGCHDNTDQ
jgi:hypothetical protein